MAEGRRPDVKQIARQVINLLEAELTAGGYDLLDVRVFQGGGRFQIRIFVDRLATEDPAANGIALDEVAFGGQFTIAAPPAFTNLWLVPRVQELLDRFPDLEMHFKTMPRIIPKALPEADVVIQFGKSSWPRKRVTSPGRKTDRSEQPMQLHFWSNTTGRQTFLCPANTG